jgi:small conductance mechanosensitive channel
VPTLQAIFEIGTKAIRRCDASAYRWGNVSVVPLLATNGFGRRCKNAVLAMSLAVLSVSPVSAQVAPGKEAQQDRPEAPAKVDVTPVAHDEAIGTRLRGVLEATEWFRGPSVRVEDGVVFLGGETATADLKAWAGDLARNTQDVAAVVNQIKVVDPVAWDFSEAWEGLGEIWRDVVRSLPLILFALIVLLLASVAGWLATRAGRAFLRTRIRANLLRGVVSRAIGGFVFLSGVYVVLRVAGLTQLALTVVGGTGLVGLAVGIAFRDITENFLASIFLSMQRPFETGDLVEVEGVTGYVQQLNVRTTVLMNLDGNLVQIPNATIYKSKLRNYTANPKRREIVTVGIGYDAAIDEAQEIVQRVLADHPAVLDEPPPWVLADAFGSATISLRIYFWIDGIEHSWLKIRSSVIRLVKRAFEEKGISMPDEAREIIFPRGVPVSMHTDAEAASSRNTQAAKDRSPRSRPVSQEVCTEAEAGLKSEAGDIQKQARAATTMDESENLLTDQAGPGKSAARESRAG